MVEQKNWCEHAGPDIVSSFLRVAKIQAEFYQQQIKESSGKEIDKSYDQQLKRELSYYRMKIKECENYLKEENKQC